jgi:integrase
MMDFAFRKGKIKEIPPFPKTEDYGIQPVEIKWLMREDSESVFNKIPKEHQPIFLWLKYHFRRLGEACALQKADFDPINGFFYVRRSVSARQDVNSVKTNWQKPTVHITNCHPEYLAMAKEILKQAPESKYFFNNPRSRKKERYTLEALRNIWYGACDAAGVPRIWTYNGVKHTACTQFVEDGGTDAELQILTGHENLASVKRYREITAKRMKQAQEAAMQRAEVMKAKERQDKLSQQPIQNLSNVIFFKKKDV